MRHRKSNRALGRNSSHRKAMLRNMVTSLIEHGSIKTTDARAKELRRIADRLVTLGKKNTVHAKRLAAQTLRTRSSLVRLFDEIAPGYAERHGGYTRMVRVGRRSGDDAPLSIIELMPPGPPELKRKISAAPTKLKATATAVKTKETFDSESTED